jgi:hypothetical protein
LLLVAAVVAEMMVVQEAAVVRGYLDLQFQ